MGMWLSTIQIHNRYDIESEQLIKTLSKIMKKKEFMPAAAEDASFSYSFVFSKNRKWITLTSPEYEPITGIVLGDAQELAKSMKTNCILTSVMDSDQASFDCFGKTGKRKDRVQIGSYGFDISEIPAEQVEENPELAVMSGYGCEPEKANIDFWKPLLVDNHTFAQLQEIWNGDYVCKEEIFSVMAPLLGMDSDVVLCDYNIMNDERCDLDVTTLHFKQDEPMFIKEGATKLTFGITSVPVSGEEGYYAFCNIGGISKGLVIIVSGDCFTNGEVVLSNVEVRRSKEPMKDYKEGKFEFEYFCAPWEKFEAPDGKVGFIAKFDDYVFVNGVNMEHYSMKGKKGDDLRWFHESSIWFTPTILSGEMHKFWLYVIPQANWEEGQIGCGVYLYRTRELLNSDEGRKFMGS